jgi:hypothetical protein
MKCRKNKHKTIIQEYRTIIGEQATIIKEQKKRIQKLQNDIQALKVLSLEDYQFYIKERKKYDNVIKQLNRILTKFNC